MYLYIFLQNIKIVYFTRGKKKLLQTVENVNELEDAAAVQSFGSGILFLCIPKNEENFTNFLFVVVRRKKENTMCFIISKNIYEQRFAMEM